MYLGRTCTLDAVSINACWREALRNESKHHVLQETFDFNPKNLMAVTQKPTQAFKMSSSEGKGTQEELEMLRTKLNETAKVPKKKFNYPMTSNQEIGWDMDTHSKHHFSKTGHAKKEYAETAYANNYVTFQK
jgi:hypothetical protein